MGTKWARPPPTGFKSKEGKLLARRRRARAVESFSLSRFVRRGRPPKRTNHSLAGRANVVASRRVRFASRGGLAFLLRRVGAARRPPTIQPCLNRLRLIRRAAPTRRKRQVPRQPTSASHRRLKPLSTCVCDTCKQPPCLRPLLSLRHGGCSQVSRGCRLQTAVADRLVSPALVGAYDTCACRQSCSQSARRGSAVTKRGCLNERAVANRLRTGLTPVHNLIDYRPRSLFPPVRP